MTGRRVFITGGTGYLGRALIPLLLERGHEVRALVRRGSESKLPEGCEAVAGDPLDSSSYAGRVAPSDTFVQLVGVPRPSPAKARQFREIDLVSGRASVEAARAARVRHFVYVSVAQPAPVMKAYQEARAEVEAALKDAGLPATVLRPWYVLGPGHRWPYLLKPFYYVCERLPPTRETARRLGFVTHAQMTAALLRAVEDPAPDFRLLTVPDIRAAAGSVIRVSIPTTV
ncbi:MAG TPA: NAD(P)H-binding protein [Pyrinomonadaceae bacterium]|nr:NAD(P)H-binding protein [Pyrinomonadaceae bacterium]